MKKLFLVALIALFSLSACVPGFLGGNAEEAPAAEAVDVAATVDAEASTQAVQTLDALDALATPTLEPTTPPMDEPTATATETLAPIEEESSPTPVETQDGTPEAEESDGVTPTADSSEVASGDETSPTPEETTTPEITETPAPTATSVYPTPTSPIAINLPPEDLVPRRRVEVKNELKGTAYISMQGVSEWGYKPIIEYQIPRFTTVNFEVPEGHYKIVVYIANRPVVDYVRVTKNTSVRIVIRRDGLKVEK